MIKTTNLKFYACQCGRLFYERKGFVRHRMSARKATRHLKHSFLGMFYHLSGRKCK